MTTYVTRPFLPPLEEFLPYLEEIWKSRWLTNGGPFHQQLESDLANYLGVEHLSLFTNGTIALVTALQSLRITGEVITTPYSFVATSHSLLWNNLTPVFVDIDPITCNLDPRRLEGAVTHKTTAILPVHCYGTPCDVAGIQTVADTFDLKVIHDAAHAFGVDLDGTSLLRAGDLSILSFHATKVFHTFEGGAIISGDRKMKQRIDHLKNFGFADEVTIMAAGINGKMSEIQAAMGLAQLRHIDELIRQRGEVATIYRRELSDVPGLRMPPSPTGFTPNYAYFPIFIEPGFRMSRDELYQAMRARGILVRRYFYPLISELAMYRGLPSASASNLPVANRLANEVLCLPIYHDLSNDDQGRVIELARGA